MYFESSKMITFVSAAVSVLICIGVECANLETPKVDGAKAETVGAASARARTENFIFRCVVINETIYEERKEMAEIIIEMCFDIFSCSLGSLG